ncbi:response regulator [Silvanigrella aquatica]|uniref:Sensory/regulatory protein RpfC n=1 Tax=Silvanigrella aquatica TaxID=1915309 RepID=A0A1L4D2F7_9BACT|nr:response regulator [Silvanigrella aquatica]APJ04389.1 hypothetical protein AXG55_10920 [Silvanigrella aquatica]
MISQDFFLWKIPYFLINKTLMISLLIISITTIIFNKYYFSYEIMLTISCISAWIITITYFLFRLVYFSGINQYLFYSKLAAIFAILCWTDIIITITNEENLIKIATYIEKIPMLIFYLSVLKNKKKYNMKVERMEPWIAAIYYLTIPIILISIYSALFSNRTANFIAEIILLYIYIIALFHAFTVSIFEYCRLGKLQDDMEKRNVEILHFAEKSKESTRLKGEFLANMSHELRTPLNGILGSANLLIGTKLNQEQRNYLEILRICGNNLLVIINEILDYSKIEANKLELEHIPFDINTCIENVFELLAPAAAAQETELIYNIDYNVPQQIIGDYTRIQQVLTHLVDNAIKFTKQGYALVKVTANLNTNNKYILKFEVRDTGSGISKKDISKLFKSFSQIDDSSTRKYGGTGLGLSIAKKLTELMGGNIGVKSDLGKGSIFNFTVITDPFKPEYVNEENDKSLQNKKIQIKSKIIFIIEKNDALLESLRNSCEGWEMETYTARSFEEALQIPTQMPPHFVLMTAEDANYEKFIHDLSGKYLDQQIIFIGMLKNSNSYYSDEKIIPKEFDAVIYKPVRYSQLFDCFIENSSANQKGKIPGIKAQQKSVAELFPLRILVAEDNVVNQKLITNMLKKFGYLCDIVANGNEVIEALTRNSYDIILMDVQMPELDGIESTKRIIAKYPKSSTRPHIIAMTAHARGAEGQICLDAGMEGYIGKPIDMKELKQVLEFWGNKANKMKTSA